MDLANGKHHVTTLAEACTWIAHHGGQIDVKWEKQDALNLVTAQNFDRIFDRIDKLTTRIAWAAGAAVMLGGVITLAAQAWGAT